MLFRSKRLESDAQIELARHERALVLKEQFAKRQEYDSLVVQQKLTQDLANEKLRQELNELKRQANAYARAQHQFTQTFSQAANQFVNRVVVPTVNVASKPFTAGHSQEANGTPSAKVFNFGGPMDMGAKAAS